MEGLPHASRLGRLPGRGRVQAWSAEWQHSGKPVRAVPRRARSHDASHHYKVGRTALHERVTRRKPGLDPSSLTQRLPPNHVP